MSDDNVPTQERVAIDTDDAADALLARWSDDENLSDESDEATAQDSVDETTDEELDTEEETEVEVEEDDEDLADDEDSDDDDDDDTEEVEDESEEVELSDDTTVDIVVDGETQQASIKNLKRLYGQEASLTRKSQELATQRKQAEDAIGKSDVVLRKMLEKAEERYKPYADVDMLVASKTMSDDDFALLRKEAQQAEQDLKFLREEADEFYGNLQQQNKVVLQEKAKECVQVLQEKIPEWSNKMYDDIRAYAISSGLPEENVNQIVDPNVIMTINKARLYDEGKKVATVKRKKASKTVKSRKAPASTKSAKAQKIQKAQKALAATNGNDFDDIASVIMSRWEE